MKAPRPGFAFALWVTVLALTIAPALAQPVSCHINGAAGTSVAVGASAKAPPLFLDRCQAQVLKGPVDVCFASNDSRIKCLPVKTGVKISEDLLTDSNRDGNSMLAMISRWLQGDPAARRLVGRGDETSSATCESAELRMPHGQVSRFAENLAWHVSDHPIRSVQVRTADGGTVIRVDRAPNVGAIQISKQSLAASQRYEVLLETDGGCQARSNFRVLSTEEQRALDDEVTRTVARTDIGAQSKALVLSSLFGSEGLAFERDQWLLQARARTGR